MIWNAAPLRVHFLLFVPLFGGAVALAIVARHREQRILLTQLPGIVATGLISWLEGSWLTTLRRITIPLLKPGIYTSAFPAVDHAQWNKSAALMRNLDKLRERIKALETTLAQQGGEG